MNYKFNDQYVAKLLMSLVRDEGNRILSLGLAKKDDLKNFVEPILQSTLKRAASEGSKTLLDNLSSLYHELSSVKLPGDFEKVAMSPEDKLFLIIDVVPDSPCSGEEFYNLQSVLEKSKWLGGKGLGLWPGGGKDDGSGPNPACPLKKDEEDDEKEDEQHAEEGLEEEIDEMSPNIHLSMVIEQLEKIAYDLGKNGNHEAAYLVERKMREIEALAANPFDSGEFDQMERQNTQQQKQDAFGGDWQAKQKWVSQQTGKISPQEWKQRSDQAAQQTRQRATNPQARREQQHQQQARQQRQQQQQPQPQAQQQRQYGQISPQVRQLWMNIKRKGKQVNLQQINQQVSQLGMDKVIKMYGL